MGQMDAGVAAFLAGLAGLLGSLVGGFISWLATHYAENRADQREHARRLEEAKSVARALAGEINFLGLQAAGRRKTIERWRAEGHQVWQMKYFREIAMPAPSVYPAFLARLGELPGGVTTKVVGFYTFLQETQFSHQRTMNILGERDVEPTTAGTQERFLQRIEEAAGWTATMLREFSGENDGRPGLRPLIDHVGPGEPG